MIVAVPRVPSALIGNRKMRPSSVPAYRRLPGPSATVVKDAPVATPTTLSKAAGPPGPPPDPVVKTIEYGVNARPLTSFTPAVRLNRYAVSAASGAVGERLTTSPPPL